MLYIFKMIFWFEWKKSGKIRSDKSVFRFENHVLMIK